MQQVISHSLSHRAPPATRTRARWQPYNSIPTPKSDRIQSPPLPYITPSNIPLSTPTPTPLCEIDRLRQALPPPPKESPLPPRESIKHKHASGLVDQAVKSLCEIWHPYDIPAAFLMSSRAAVTVGGAPDALLSLPRPSVVGSKSAPSSLHPATHLPSPISPSTSCSPNVPFCQPATTTSDATNTMVFRCNVVPMKGFVHEVLRRSRTSGSVLQAALCYLEAIRTKVPELVRLEKEGKGVRGDPDLGGRIIKMDDSSSSDSSTLVDDASTRAGSPQLLATLKVVDEDEVLQQQTPPFSQVPDLDKTPTNEHPNGALPSAHLPSPLLCPRRAFLAALILASKFNQDRCYSNRAWAKLSGLPAREIGRCERALGDALEWRLWVGKKQPSRSLGRCQSEGGIFGAESKARSARSAVAPPPLHPLGPLPSIVAPATTSRTTGGLRRTRTAPAIDFLPPPPPPIFPISESTPTPMLASTSKLSLASFTAPYSPISPVPSLSHSPSSTESSGGDQTIQMASYFDDGAFINTNASSFPTPLPACIPPPSSCGTDATWSWTSTTSTSFPPTSHPTPIHDPPSETLLPKAMMDGVTNSNDTIPEPMVGVVQGGFGGYQHHAHAYGRAMGGSYCGQDEVFNMNTYSTNGTNPTMGWDHSLVY